MPLVPFDIPSGLVRSDSQLAAKGRYTDADKVHFVSGAPEKWGGWAKWLSSASIMLGMARSGTAWANAAGNQNASFGTHLKLYAITGEDRLRDITPIRASGTYPATNPLAVTNGSLTVVVTHVAHGADNNDYVTIGGSDGAFVINRTLGTNIGDATAAGGLAAAFDNTTNQAAAACAQKAAATFAYVGKTLATSAPIKKAVVYGSNDNGYVTGANPTITIDLYGKQGAAPANSTDGTILGTLAFTDSADEHLAPRTITSSDTTTIWDHGWVRVGQSGGAATMSIAEVQLYAYVLVSGEYQLSKIDADSYSITIAAPAPLTTASGGGAAVTYSYQIHVGSIGTVFGFGWGAATWDTGTWGTPRDTTTGVKIELRYWSVQEYGNNLLALPSGGRLYLWTEATDTNAQLVANSPASARYIFVSGERFVFELGTTTPMTVDWPDQDDITDWTPTANNTANTRNLQSGSKLMAGTAFADLLNLVWSDTTLYLFQYTGSTFIYEPRIVGRNCGLAAPGGFCIAKGVAYWLSSGDFYRYSGSVESVPNKDDISGFVFADINQEHITKTQCIFNQRKNCVMWMYVSNDSANAEPDKYVEVSLDDYSWVTGTIDRSTAVLFRPADGSILMVNNSGVIYEHEIDNDADGAALESYITFGFYTLTNGETVADILGFVPDCQRQTGALTFEISTKDRPRSATTFDSAIASLGVTDEIADIRVSGRHFTWTVRSNVIGGDFRLGTPSLELQEAGSRR